MGGAIKFALPNKEIDQLFNFLQPIIMAVQRLNPQIKLFDAAAAKASSVPTLVQDRQHLFLTLATSWNANCTIKVQISYQETEPDFSAAASPTNQWSYVQVKLATTAAAIDGATGIVLTGTDSTMNYTVNIEWARRIGATITAISAGAITLLLAARNNQ